MSIKDYLGEWLYIKNLNSGKYMEVDSHELENGADIRQWELDGQNENKQWWISEYPDGGYLITNRLSGKVVEFDSNKCEEGTNVRQWEFDDNPTNKVWDFKETDGSWKISPSTNDCDLLIEVKEHSDDNGATVRMWEDDDADFNKRWIISKVSGSNSERQLRTARRRR